MVKNLIVFLGVIALILVVINVFNKEDPYNLKLEKLKHDYSIAPIPSVDHSKFDVLRVKFETPQEVTETCISCHTERHKEVMASSHWNWERISFTEGRGVISAGKKNVVNNFCIGSGSNEQACAACHIGFGMDNNQYDFTNARNVDCMVCHDNSEEYLKGSAMAGYPDRSVNLNKVAQSVGSPKKSNCGACHFFSGGGNNVKHGDLEGALLSCDRMVDVHMAENGMDLECVACHTAENHQILGRLYSVSTENTKRATCEQCHTNKPHLDDVLNRHNSKVACQTCHIPEYAKVNATKMNWYWSEAGKLKDGEPYIETDSAGNITYMSQKGTFEWEKNARPDYRWFNGTADLYLLGDTISTRPVPINTLFGSYDDEDSKIIPVKINVGDQIYDPVYNQFIQPKLYSDQKGDSAYWMDFDWATAAEAGMRTVGIPYSGEYGFVETVMYWPVNHMVAPKEHSVDCAECHTRENGRLAELNDFYLPGRDRNVFLSTAGSWLFILSLIGVIAHGALRIASNIFKNRYEKEVINKDKQ
jgi:octaheme c-type cytochrome (tetrathionate reductase family)